MLDAQSATAQRERAKLRIVVVGLNANLGLIRRLCHPTSGYVIRGQPGLDMICGQACHFQGLGMGIEYVRLSREWRSRSVSRMASASPHEYTYGCAADILGGLEGNVSEGNGKSRRICGSSQ